ncbi:ABC transporter permease [Dactylosporangium sp. NPDC051484]|uniref:ABC transporter permease n=1 Tax=Dactylosporangium sp. NPDC051484 TaxID=3154942 RepID=UPI0034503594
MTTTATVPARAPRLAGRRWQDLWTAGLPAAGLALMLIVLRLVEPGTFTAEGMSLVLRSSTPLVLAATAQLCIIAVGDLDLGVGSALGFVNVVIASWLASDPVWGWLALAGVIGAYMAMGALIHVRRLPAIMVTLAASFVWLGVAMLVLPTPGGMAPGWLARWAYWDTPLVPLPIVLAAAVAIVASLILNRSRLGMIVRALGSNPRALDSAGRSSARARVAAYGLAGCFVVLAGFAVTANTASGDAHGTSGYTILTIAAVILGGARFSGGVVAPVGAVLGAITLGLVASVLTFLNVSSDYQTGIQGLLLLVVLAGRALGRRSR